MEIITSTPTKKKQKNKNAKISTTLPCILDNHDLSEGVQKRKRRADITNKKKSKNTKTVRGAEELKEKPVKD